MSVLVSLNQDCFNLNVGNMYTHLPIYAVNASRDEPRKKESIQKREMGTKREVGLDESL